MEENFVAFLFSISLHKLHGTFPRYRQMPGKNSGWTIQEYLALNFALNIDNDNRRENM
jgi:hypothetical protein